MKMRENRHGMINVAVALLALLGLCTTSAMAAYMRNLSTEEMVKKADVICIGTVEKKESRWISGHIETTMAINVSEYLKGNLGSAVEITQMGGVLEEPIPIAQHVTGMPEFYKDEEVLLFLSTQKKQFTFTPEKAPDPKSRLLDSPQVVGLEQGKYTIVTDPQTGEKRVTHFRLENIGILPDGKIADKAFDAMTQPTEAQPASTPQSPLANVPKSRIRALVKAGQLPSLPASGAKKSETALSAKSGSATEDAQLGSKAAPDESPIIFVGKDLPVSSGVFALRSQQPDAQASETSAEDEAIPPALQFSKLKTLNDFKVEIQTILNK
jgi:hypothetical protein